jgi:hypothetical protein
MSGMTWKLFGVALVPLTIAVGLLIPASSTTGIAIPMMFVFSGVMIGRWWAPLPSLTAVVGLNLGELAGIGHSGAISLHANDFAPSFLLWSSAIATGLAAAGAMARWVVWLATSKLRGLASR